MLACNRESGSLPVSRDFWKINQGLWVQNSLLSLCWQFTFKTWATSFIHHTFPDNTRLSCSANEYQTGERCSRSTSSPIQDLSSLSYIYILSSYHIVNSVCCSHDLVSGPTPKRPALDDGLCIGKLCRWWCDRPSVLARHTHMLHCPHFFIDIYWPTTVCSMVRVVQSFYTDLPLDVFSWVCITALPD